MLSAAGLFTVADETRGTHPSAASRDKDLKLVKLLDEGKTVSFAALEKEYAWARLIPGGHEVTERSTLEQIRRNVVELAATRKYLELRRYIDAVEANATQHLLPEMRHLRVVCRVHQSQEDKTIEKDSRWKLLAATAKKDVDAVEASQAPYMFLSTMKANVIDIARQRTRWTTVSLEVEAIMLFFTDISPVASSLVNAPLPGMGTRLSAAACASLTLPYSKKRGPPPPHKPTC